MHRGSPSPLLFCPLGIKCTQAEARCLFSPCAGHRGPFPERNVRGHPAPIGNSCISASCPLVEHPLLLARESWPLLPRTFLLSLLLLAVLPVSTSQGTSVGRTARGAFAKEVDRLLWLSLRSSPPSTAAVHSGRAERPQQPCRARPVPL